VAGTAGGGRRNDGPIRPATGIPLPSIIKLTASDLAQRLARHRPHLPRGVV